MIIDNLFREILVDPVSIGGADKLYIVSGYATSAMAFSHLNTIHEINSDISINLIIGMSSQDGLSESNHRGFKNLMENEFPETFKCSYTTNLPSVHSKVYVWCKNNLPLKAFLGSANYTQMAFLKSRIRKEAMTDCSAEKGLNYFNTLTENTIYCTHIDTENLINIYNDKNYRHIKSKKKEGETSQDDILTPKSAIEGLEHVRVSLITRQGKVPDRSGLNWGQRPGREPNQAYLSLSSSVYKTDFFPDRTTHFTVCTDDNKILICTRAQQNSKAIQTPHNNSLIGEYFRRRLGLKSGVKVTIDDLLRYGRTDIDFYKIDNETYFMDFSVR